MVISMMLLLQPQHSIRALKPSTCAFWTIVIIGEIISSLRYNFRRASCLYVKERHNHQYDIVSILKAFIAFLILIINKLLVLFATSSVFSVWTINLYVRLVSLASALLLVARVHSGRECLLSGPAS